MTIGVKTFTNLAKLVFEEKLILCSLYSISNSSMENISANFSMECGTYEQLEYWPNNFDDFAVSSLSFDDFAVSSFEFRSTTTISFHSYLCNIHTSAYLISPKFNINCQI